jgi:hypothetical protein
MSEASTVLFLMFSRCIGRQSLTCHLFYSCACATLTDISILARCQHSIDVFIHVRVGHQVLRTVSTLTRRFDSCPGWTPSHEVSILELCQCSLDVFCSCPDWTPSREVSILELCQCSLDVLVRVPVSSFPFCATSTST